MQRQRDADHDDCAREQERSRTAAKEHSTSSHDNRRARDIGQKIVEQDLRSEQWQKRQEQRSHGHAEHVAEVCTDGRQDVLVSVGKRPATFVDAVTQNVQVLFEQHKIRSIFRNILGGIHRDADVCSMQGWRVVNAVAHVADDMPGLLECQNDTFLLVGVHFGEDGGPCCGMPECFITHAIEIISCQQTTDRKVDCLRDMPRHLLIIAGDDLELNTSPGKIDDRLRDIRLGWIEEQQEALKLKCILILA